MKTKIPTVAEVQELQVRNYEKCMADLESFLIEETSHLIERIRNYLVDSIKFPIEIKLEESYHDNYRDRLMSMVLRELKSADQRYTLTHSLNLNPDALKPHLILIISIL